VDFLAFLYEVLEDEEDPSGHMDFKYFIVLDEVYKNLVNR
jgi:hypothetical protein